MILAAAVLSACSRELVTEMESRQANVSAYKKDKKAIAAARVLQWQIEPAGVNPLIYRTTLALQLNNWELLKKEAAKASWQYLQLSVDATPQTPVSMEEYS